MNVLDLFSGIGGFSLGLERAGPFRTVAFCEREPFPQAVLRKHWPEVPIYDDVRTIPTERLERIDLICGGFPCQPWSVAGQQRGTEDDRDLWPAMAALVEELRPTWVIGENVRGFVNEPMGLKRSLSDLESLGYEAAAFVIPACAVDAPHRRDRVWIVANSDNAIGRRGKERRQGWHGQSELHGAERLAAHADSKVEPDGAFDARQGCGELGAVADADSERRYGGAEEHGSHGREFVAGNGEAVADARRHATRASEEMDGDTPKRSQGIFDAANGSKDVADTCGTHVEGQRVTKRIQTKRSATSSASRWLPEPDVGRVAHGVPRRVDRLKALGNAVVPQVVEQIGRAILEAENAP
jgi:DNA (cytosine-5)-methyltransferase 1